MSEIECNVLYSEPSQMVLLKVPSNTTVQELKNLGISRMQSHMDKLVPGVELDVSCSELHPDFEQNQTSVADLQAKTVTLLVWPKPKRYGQAASPVHEQLMNTTQPPKTVTSNNDTSTELATLREQVTELSRQITELQHVNKKVAEENTRFRETTRMLLEAAAKASGDSETKCEQRMSSLEEQKKKLENNIAELKSDMSQLKEQKDISIEETRILKDKVEILEQNSMESPSF
ncbi:hypothetical protein BDZ91DRAFT_853024 [Kalaharituber pfeilii]|nr:hypothetical protein BDZ91DRAFT_853024 [Kalaharituber pfeilii]